MRRALPLLAFPLVALAIALAGPALASELGRWPLDQLVVRTLEKQCELLQEEGGELPHLAQTLVAVAPNSPDAHAASAIALASLAGRERGGDMAFTHATAALERATRLARGADRPVVRFARGALAIARGRRSAGADRRSELAAGDADLAEVALSTSATPTLRFHAHALRLLAAFEARDRDAARSRYAETLVAASAAHLEPIFDRILRETCLRRFAEIGAFDLVEREALHLARTQIFFVHRRRWMRRPLAPEDPGIDLADWRARALLALDRPAEALGETKKPATGVRPWWRRVVAAQALLDLGRPEEARVHARAFRNVVPSHASHELVGRAALASGRLDEAAASFAQALRTDGATCATCLAGAAAALVRGGRTDALAAGDEERRAEELVARARRIDEEAPAVLEARALLARRRGDRRRANELLVRSREPSARARARELDRLVDAARKALERDRADEAIDLAAEAVAQRPTCTPALRTLAEATARRPGDPRTAYLVELVTDVEQDAWALLERGRAREDSGQLEEARELLQRALALRSHPTNEREAQERRDAIRLLATVKQELRHRKPTR